MYVLLGERATGRFVSGSRGTPGEVRSEAAAHRISFYKDGAEYEPFGVTHCKRDLILLEAQLARCAVASWALSLATGS